MQSYFRDSALALSTMKTTNELPGQSELLWPTLRTLERLGGSASIGELGDSLAADLGLTDAALEIPHGNGTKTEFDHRAGWARTRLRRIGAVDNPSRGVWTITKEGRGVGSAEELRERVRRQQHEYRKRLRNRTDGPESAEDAVDNEVEATGFASGDEGWQADLLGILRGVAPDAFERLCQRLLREHGFARVEVTGRSGDGGIDGTGVLRVNLVSFHVSYQCKRYAGAVGPAAIRDFRGAMVGRADKGLFITTGRFTKEAQREAVRDGAVAVDLIDGVDLCGLLKDKGLGVASETIERVTLNPRFFDTL